MSRFCFAAIYTAFVLPGLLLAPPAGALWRDSPSVGEALGQNLPSWTWPGTTNKEMGN